LGATVILAAEDVTITIPIGTSGIQIAFDDVTRTLLFDTALNVARLGLQTITTVETGVMPFGASVMVVGTEGADTINGTTGDDVIDGLGGNDTINGLGGDDFLRGGLGDDTLIGGFGDDQIYGGGGNDRIIDNEGDYAVLDGGAGNDHISVANVVATSLNISGGDGDDRIDLTLGAVGVAYVDAGNGADRVTVSSLGAEVSVLLGAGRDELIFPAGALGTGNFGLTIIRDFEAGPNGDKVDLASALTGYLVNWTQGTNPFATGHLRLVSIFGNAFLEVDRDGGTGPGGFKQLINFAGLNKDTLTADNLGGLDPKASTATTAAAGIAAAAVPEAFAHEASPFDDLGYVSPELLNPATDYGAYYFLA
jgi:Ca2+-binding RTX toxin-like protein